jgi:hypothetical protein
VLWRIFGPKMDRVTGEWRKLHNEDLNDLYFHPALYGCETWSHTLMKERRLGVSKNKVLRRIFWPKRDEVKGEWRKLHYEELSDLYSSPNFVRVINSRRMGWTEHVARLQARKSVQQNFGGET